VPALERTVTVAAAPLILTPKIVVPDAVPGGAPAADPTISTQEAVRGNPEIAASLRWTAELVSLQSAWALPAGTADSYARAAQIAPHPRTIGPHL
jgi:hypothetical protein